MDKTTLSKHKHIHRLYYADDGKYHIEKFPVVYMNEKYTYFKTGRQQMLVHVRTDAVYNSCEEFDEEHLWRYVSIYFWEAEENALEIVRRKKEECRRKTLEKELKRKYDDYVEARERFIMAQENFVCAKEAFEEEYGEAELNV